MRKVLFVSYDLPYPTNTGGKNRAFNLIKYASKDIELHLASFIREDFRKEYEEELRKINVKTISVFKRRKLLSFANIKFLFSKNASIFKYLYYNHEVEALLLKLIKSLKIDIVHFESYYTAFYIGDKIRSLGAKQIFGTENIEHFLYRDYAKSSNLLKRIFLDKQIKKVENEEVKLFKTSDRNLAVTAEEAGFIEKLTGKKCDVIRNGVDLKEFAYKYPSKEIKNTLLFIGNFTYFPNRDAINYFYNSIFKKLDSKIKLLIIGKNAQKLKIRNDRRIEIIPFVEDIKEAYGKSDIMISPVRIGGGTNFKVLEAMALGVPVVAYSIRVKSLEVKDNLEILLAKTPDEYIQKINILFKDYDLRKEISENARRLVEKKYSWEVIGKKLAQVWENL